MAPLIALFAKAPRAGDVKTRLAPAVGAEGAARLAGAFLADTWRVVSGLPWAEAVVAAPGGDAGIDAPTWDQGEGDLGARMERVLRRALHDRRAAFAVGADAPGVPAALFVAANDALNRFDAVLGPTPDGGFWLIGLRECPEGLLADLPWSEPSTFDRTRARLVERGMTVAVLSPFPDVDRPEDLRRLRAILDAGADAPATDAVLRDLLPDLRPRLSVVVPVLDEAARVAACLDALTRLPGVDEIVVVDGGSRDGTRAIARAFAGVRLLDAPRGRARQMNAGAAVARGEVLLFLHADVRLPDDAPAHIEAALADPAHVAGAFRTWTIAERPWALAPLLHLCDLRSRVTRLPYGDQALFVRRSAFEAVGGFPDQPLMEDVEIAHRLRRLGRIALADARVEVSGRRWLARPLYTTFVMWTWPTLYRLGVPPALLKRWYADVR